GVHGSPAGVGLALDHQHLLAEVRGLCGALFSCGTCADHDQIEALTHGIHAARLHPPARSERAAVPVSFAAAPLTGRLADVLICGRAPYGATGRRSYLRPRPLRGDWPTFSFAAAPLTGRLADHPRRRRAPPPRGRRAG